MKHATPETIAALAPFIDRICALPGLKEKTPGVFYRKSRSFLHFHEAGGDLYADVRFEGSDFERIRTSTKQEQAALVTRLQNNLKADV